MKFCIVSSLLCIIFSFVFDIRFTMGVVLQLPCKFTILRLNLSNQWIEIWMPFVSMLPCLSLSNVLSLPFIVRKLSSLKVECIVSAKMLSKVF